MGKSLWLPDEMWLLYPNEISPFVEEIAAFLYVDDAFLREQVLNAFGRIGRADCTLIKPYRERIFSLAKDDDLNVRLAFIWTSENIATNTPEVYQKSISVFEKLLDYENIQIRMEASEIFRVLGKRKSKYVYDCRDKLKSMERLMVMKYFKKLLLFSIA